MENGAKFSITGIRRLSFKWWCDAIDKKRLGITNSCNLDSGTPSFFCSMLCFSMGFLGQSSYLSFFDSSFPSQKSIATTLDDWPSATRFATYRLYLERFCWSEEPEKEKDQCDGTDRLLEAAPFTS
jgi:hypothetical protein